MPYQLHTRAGLSPPFNSTNKRFLNTGSGGAAAGAGNIADGFTATQIVIELETQLGVFNTAQSSTHNWLLQTNITNTSGNTYAGIHWMANGQIRCSAGGTASNRIITSPASYSTGDVIKIRWELSLPGTTGTQTLFINDVQVASGVAHNGAFASATTRFALNSVCANDNSVLEERFTDQKIRNFLIDYIDGGYKREWIFNQSTGFSVPNTANAVNDPLYLYGGNGINSLGTNWPEDDSHWELYGSSSEQRSSTFTSTASASTSFAGVKTEVETKSSSFTSSQSSASTLSGSALERAVGTITSANTQTSNFNGSALEVAASTITSLNSAVASFQGSATEVVSTSFSSLNETVATFSGSALERTASSFISSQEATASFGGFKTEQGVSSGTIASLNNSSSSLTGVKVATVGLSSTQQSLASFSGSKLEQEVIGGVIQSLQTTTSSFSGFKTEQEVTGGVIQSLQSAVAVFEGFKTENESRNGSLTSLQGATSSFSGSKGVTVQISSNNASEVDLEGFKTVSTDLVSNVVGSSNFRGYNAALPPAKLDIFLDTSSNLSFILDTVTPELNFGTNQNMYLVVNSSSQLEVQL